MLEEACCEFPYGERHCFLFVVTVIFAPEADTVVIASQNPTVADGYPVGVSSQVADDLICSSERFF